MIDNIREQVIQTNKNKVLVKSPAAGGKTALIVDRINYLLDNGVNPKKIVAITFTNNAASEMYARVSGPKKSLFIGTVHSYCNYLLKSGGIETSDIIDSEKFDKLFDRIRDNPYCIREIEYLIVDECQDSTRNQFEFFELLHPKHYMYVYDIRQSIYGFSDAEPEYLIEKEKEPDVTTYELPNNYRNGQDILGFAKRLLKPLGSNYYDNSVGARPEKGKLVTGELSIFSCVNIVKKDGNYKDWFILLRTNAEIQNFIKELERQGVPYDTFRQADLDNSEIQKKMADNTVKVLTVHSSKGLEANKVLVYDPKLYNDEERRLYYVAATRARDVLYWIKKPKKKRKQKTYNWG